MWKHYVVLLLFSCTSGEAKRKTILQWQSVRQTVTATSAAEAEITAMADALMPALHLLDALQQTGLPLVQTPHMHLPLYTDSTVAIRQLKNQSLTVRKDVCDETCLCS